MIVIFLNKGRKYNSNHAKETNIWIKGAQLLPFYFPSRIFISLKCKMEISSSQ